MVKLELLSPAKNYEYGIAAINAGADAVYIGAPKFGARQNATNTIEDIAKLTEYAHLFDVKVFVTLNTILFDEELEEAEKIARELVDIGVDALIIQDASYLSMNLEIPLHASTQYAANTPSKVQFAESAGFERVILERSLSIKEIKDIRSKTKVELEAFVFGAICVSDSGQCYMGQATSGRSGNRGVCSQPCRSKYNLINDKGTTLLKDKHLLSLTDLNLTDHLPQLISAGVTSFKIEGRLKDLTYLRNSVTYLRSKLDQFIANNKNYSRSSIGVSEAGFTPQPEKCFSRRLTAYFADGTPSFAIASFDTAKALGEYIGKVERVSKSDVTVSSTKTFTSGDGICFINTNGSFGGTNINNSKAEGGKVILQPNIITGIQKGAVLYRNYDKAFSDKLIACNTQRKISTTIHIHFGSSITLKAYDSTGVSTSITVRKHHEPAKNLNKSRSSILTQLSKSGDTIFTIKEVIIDNPPEEICFIPISELNNLRRTLLNKLQKERAKRYTRAEAQSIKHPKAYSNSLTSRANVSNSKALNYYCECGFKDIDMAYEVRGIDDSTILMDCRYCIRREIGECLKEGGSKETLFIENMGKRYELVFDCKECRMKIRQA